ncbi:MAG: glycosyltransferase family 2 protein [Pseudobutyrivibrio sp.]|uniref:glycosyltransferase family 2 protein n=1 Tax=Pseudobutyrivibrio sp. TaxID=2014367 RepID=UPI0025F59369|nr:glycosyltransferase family 2 protein [Pseudobutyrivibrio sp.]MBQ6464052.1 glycosyltransferase family 2 protein [Pseudobutyrivibrio sp.]
MRLSIIVPVYNVERYLDKCIQSIIGQDFEDFELILIDDGSTDGSGELCDKWAVKDERVIVYHKQNGGLISAWKYGLNKSKGDYIGFVDADDWIDSNMYSCLINSAIRTNADIVMTSLVWEYVYTNKKTYEKQFFPAGCYNFMMKHELIYPFLFRGDHYKKRGISASRVTKLYRRELLIDNIKYFNDKLTIGEDLVTTFASVINAKTIYIIDDFNPYHYNIHNYSMINTINNDRYTQIELLYESLSIINENADYDFSGQIYTDFIHLLFQTFEIEMYNCSLFPVNKMFEINRHIKDIYNKETMQIFVKNIDLRELNIHDKIWYKMLNTNTFFLCIIIRLIILSLKKVLKSFKRVVNWSIYNVK